MKNLLFILAIATCLIVGCGPSAHAQQTATSANAVNYDTVSLSTAWYHNTDTKIMYVKVSNAWDVASVQAVITKSTGTVAGSAWPVVSNDGLNFVTYLRPSIAAPTLRPSYSATLTLTKVSTNPKVCVLSHR